MPRITFVEFGGAERSVEADSGATVMEAGVRNGVRGIVAECGGACACATCHVYVDSDWIERMPPPGLMEAEMLEFAIEPRPGSRLSCQITIDGTLDGLVVRVPETQS